MDYNLRNIGDGEMRSLTVGQEGSLTPNEGALPISQQRLWVLERLHPGSPAHNVACGCRIKGPFDATKIGFAWRYTVQQYEILRMQFHAVEGVPKAVVVTSVSQPLTPVDLEGVPQAEREVRLSQLMLAEAQRPFDLATAPLLRPSLWRLAPMEHVFLLVGHRIVCDEVSLEIVLSELARNYVSGETEGAHRTIQPRVQYSAFVSCKGSVSDEDISYWKRRLAGAPSSIDLPIDRQRRLERTFRGTSQRLVIGRSVVEQLQRLGAGHGVTLFMTLVAAFNVLLSRYSRQEDVVVGTVIPRRGDPKLKTLVGPSENIVVLRTDLSGDPKFSEILTRIRNISVEAFSHQDVPFEVLVDQLPLERDLSRSPVFQVAFNQKIPLESFVTANLHWEPIQFENETEILDLTVSVVERNGEVESQFSYNTEIFEHRTIERMIRHFQTLLRSVVENPDQPISHLAVLTNSERRQIVVEWNEPAIRYSAVECVHELVEAQVERTPNAVAVTYNDQSITYDELNRRANKLAHYLRSIGVRPDTRVAICVERGFEMIVAVLGVLKAGGGYVPLDPAYPTERLQYMLGDSGATALLTHGNLKGLFEGCGALPVVDVGEGNPLISDQPMTNQDRASIGLTSMHLAYVIYTSGSTGAPKGVMIEHRNITRLFTATEGWFHFSANDVWTLFHSYAFDFSVWEIWGALLYGGRVVVVSQNAARLPEDFYALICREKVTILNQTPSAFRQLITAQTKIEASHQLRHVIFGGEALEVATLKPWYEQNRNSHTQLVNMYGITETTVHVTYYPLKPTDTVRRGGSPIGSRIPDLRIYILDGHREPVPIGVVGELYVAGAGVARGYLNRPQLTAERFLEDPFANESRERMYKTGDLGRWRPDGTIEFLGRNDFQVKIRGFRIELGEIEARLGEYSGVREATVIIREDSPGEKRLVAYYTCDQESGQSISAGLLRAHVVAKLPDYMVPAAYVQLDSMPLTENGKLNIKELPLPRGDAYAASIYEPPQGQTEAILSKVWEDVLSLDRVGRHDNFFDLGGHSLTAARLLSQLKEITGRHIPLSALFRGATVESLAHLIDEQGEAVNPLVMEIHRGASSRLPFFAIVPPGEESLGYAMLARHMGSGQTVFKIQAHEPIVDSNRPYSKQEMQKLTEEYVAAMRTVQAHGPYCLGGLCDGAHIAEQIVLSLEAQGEEVGLFAIFDTWVMQHSQRRWLWKVDYYLQRLREMKRMNLSERLVTYKRVAKNKVGTLLGKEPPRTDWEETYWPQDFTPPRYRAPVVLFKRPKQQFYYVNDPQMGWGRRSESGVEIYEIDFHHLEILREPHVRLFGEKLAECIARVSQRNIKLEA